MTRTIPAATMRQIIADLITAGDLVHEVIALYPKDPTAVALIELSRHRIQKARAALLGVSLADVVVQDGDG